MPYTLWSQDVFSKGELSPYMYARATVNEYGYGLKTAQNVLTYPTGAAGKRFGTLFQSFLFNVSNYKEFFFETFQYLNECVYQVIFSSNNIDVYLEGILVANVATTLSGPQVYNLSTTVLGSAFRVAGNGFMPYDLVRSPNSPEAILGIASNTFTVGAPIFTPGVVYPIQFTTSGTLPLTNPIILSGVTYFAYANTAFSFSMYETSNDARYQRNAFTLNNIGTGTNNVVVQNTWTFNHSVFTDLPFYDFNGTVVSYDALTFTPSAVSGASVTITVSSAYAPLDSSYVGGVFIGGGGTSRITQVASTTSFTVAVQEPFDSTGAIQGSLALLAEPAWSDTRGWPKICGSYQNRALFANTTSLPNGFWTSVINNYANFGNLTNDDDDAISWFPSSNNVNYIRFLVPYRSMTVHTNTGIYSSPLSDVVAITPSNFTLQLQDSTPADVLQPQAIDNQVLVLSGNDAHQMLWDGINNAYTSDIVSVVNEQTIRNPIDEAAYADLNRAGSRYIFIINDNGSMAVFQTLIAQNVSGFTPHIMEQSYGTAKFRQAASSADGRAWFVVERQLAEAAASVGFNAILDPTTIVQALGLDLPTDSVTAVKFTTADVLASSTPQINTDDYYWAVGTDPSAFKVYLTQEDALNDENAIEWNNIGNLTSVQPWPLSTFFTLEELTHDTYLDCAIYYNGTPTDSVYTSILFNAQTVKMVGDGFGFEAEGINDHVNFTAHGEEVPVSEAYIGFPITTIMQPMPLVIANGNSAKTTTLTKPKHIRSIRFIFNNTIGGTINGVPIALKHFDQADIGEPPFPGRGIMEIMPFKGWDDFNVPTYTIEHNDPFNIELLGVFYSVEI